MGIANYMGSYMGTDIFQSPTELGIRTVKQEQEIELLKRQLKKQEHMQCQISGYGQVPTCDSGTSYAVCGSGVTNTVPAPVKKDTNKIKNLIAYYYKR